jgi:hypothetical protein
MLADRNGQGRVLRPLVLAFAAATAALIGCAQIRAPAWALLVTGVAAGAATPSVGSMVRARWSALLAGSPRSRWSPWLTRSFSWSGRCWSRCWRPEVYPASGVRVAAGARWGYAFAAACATGAVLACLLGLGSVGVPCLDRSPSAADAQATG